MNGYPDVPAQHARSAKVSEYRPRGLLELRFAHEPGEAHSFLWSSPADAYLRALREDFGLDRLVSDSGDELGVVLRACSWAHGLWKHDGYNRPDAADPAAILREAASGKSFRCVEYSIVLAGALTALGTPARVLGLKREDCEESERGAGHVVVEAYLSEPGRWIMADAQFDAVPVAAGMPLGAVELRAELARGCRGTGLLSSSGQDPDEYLAWIAPYLYYFDVAPDNRFGPGIPGYTRDGRLMLVPVGAKKPTVFQRDQTLGSPTYTHSASAFYAPPA